MGWSWLGSRRCLRVAHRIASDTFQLVRALPTKVGMTSSADCGRGRCYLQLAASRSAAKFADMVGGAQDTLAVRACRQLSRGTRLCGMQPAGKGAPPLLQTSRVAGIGITGARHLWLPSNVAPSDWGAAIVLFALLCPNVWTSLVCSALAAGVPQIPRLAVTPECPR